MQRLILPKWATYGSLMVPDIPAIAFVFSQLLRARLLATAYLFPKYLVQASCPKVGPELIEMKWGYGAAINGRLNG